jgi:hypothetical protein
MKVSILAMVATATMMITGSAAFAQDVVGFSIAEVGQVAKVATDKFAAENVAYVDHFVGYKAWKAGLEAKVKVYVDHDGMPMEFNYNCHKHDDGALECHNL